VVVKIERRKKKKKKEKGGGSMKSEHCLPSIFISSCHCAVIEKGEEGKGRREMEEL